MVDKWTCRKCTLENHKASKKCCMCKHPRSSAAAPPLNIYDVALSEGRQRMPGASCGGGGGSGANGGSSWLCDHCTYSNTTGTKCTMCGAKYDQRNGRNRARIRNNSPASPGGRNGGGGGGGAVGGATSPISKWKCARCTYDNFARSLKCTICMEPRLCGSGLVSPSSSSAASPPVPASPDASGSCNTLTSILPLTLPAPSEERRSPRNLDRLWLTTCRQIIDGDNTTALVAYLTAGGDLKRKITGEESVALHYSFACNCTLSLLALRFHRSKVVESLMPASRPKRVPSHVSPRLSEELLAYWSNTAKQRKDDFPCYFVTECPTFFLPQDINELTISARKLLFDDLIDTDVQKELEEKDSIINWSKELYDLLDSKLYALWNRSSGNCLLDSLLQVTLGIFDSNDSMRKILADTLTDASNLFYEKWATNEQLQARLLDYCITDSQLRKEWKNILKIARQPGSSLEQIHIFAMSHVLRRPIIVYGIKFVKSYHGDDIGFARFQGVYLPLLWDKSFCWSSPVVLGYTRGHFSALVCMATSPSDRLRNRTNQHSNSAEDSGAAYMPLIDSKGDLLNIYYLPVEEIDKSQAIFNEWMDCHVTRDGVLVAKQNQTQFSQSRVVKMMLDEWLLSYHEDETGSPPHASTSRDQSLS